MNKTSVGILGASGYAGRELCRLVLEHPGLELAFAAANDQQGATIRIAGRAVTFVAAEEAPLESAALVFSALPHGTSAAWVARAAAAGARVVDLSADLRPGHGRPGNTPACFDRAPYGLTERERGTMAGARVVANPGCYPTAILLALAPLIEHDLIADDASIVVNAASGVTGAGATPKRELLFAEVTEDYRAYGVGNVHQHVAEMREAVARWRGRDDLDVIFTPHLLPVARGLLASITVPLKAPLADPLEPWQSMYAGEQFIEVTSAPPALRDVVWRNVARISACMVSSTRRPTVLVLSAIDNLLKGAAGQAMQNANVLLGFPEALGLPA